MSETGTAPKKTRKARTLSIETLMSNLQKYEELSTKTRQQLTERLASVGLSVEQG